MTAPTKASLQRELRAMTKRAEDLDAMHTQAIKALNKALSAYIDTMDSKTALQSKHDRIRLRLRPVLAYFGQQWIGDAVRKEYQELVMFSMGGSGE